MLTIEVPKNNIKERKYIIDVFFKEFLDLEYEFVIGEIDYWKITLENGNKLVIQDHFFNSFAKKLDYLKLENLPNDVKLFNNDFATEKDVVVIFGNEDIILNETMLVCGIDIFASSFFMLTRWEEYVNPKKDEFKRFSAQESISFKFSFLDRPIVNEYIEMLWNMLQKQGIQQNRKKWDFKVLPSHDVDNPFFIPNRFMKKIKRIIGIFITTKSFYKTFQVLFEFIYKKDRFNTFEELILISEKNGLVSTFNFMNSSKTDRDIGYEYDVRVINLIKKINSSNHKIGFHPSFYTLNDTELFSNELNGLNKILFSITNKKIEEGRQHYLRFDIPNTWRIWEENSLKIDSSLTYYDKEGFRCGVCYEYTVFDILERKQLNLKELPLLVMEGSLMKYQKNNDFEDIYNRVSELKEKVCKYNGKFTILTHNTTMSNKVWNGWADCYERIVGS